MTSSIIVSLLETDEDILRRKLLISLGWVASSKEIDLLARHMISDKDALSRAWSATSLMQMLYNGVDQEELQEKTKPVFAKSLAEEKDIYASGLIILYLTLFLTVKAGKASNTNTSGFLYYV